MLVSETAAAGNEMRPGQWPRGTSRKRPRDAAGPDLGKPSPPGASQPVNPIRAGRI